MTPTIAHEDLRIHPDTRRTSDEPLRLVTSSTPWAYAVSVPLAVPEGRTAGTLRVAVSLAVSAGRLGVGILNEAGDAFVAERFVGPSDGEATIALRVHNPARLGLLVIRNADTRHEGSALTLGPIAVEWEDRRAWPIVASRNVAAEMAEDEGDGRVFEAQEAARINRARLRLIESLALPLAGSRVIDVGSGPGHFVDFYASRGCEVVAVDARPDNVAELTRRHPAIRAVTADAERDDLRGLGRFDLVHCFGLLYHLESPLAALRNMYQVCGRLLLLETMVADSELPIVVLADEPKVVNQALRGLGSRPSPLFVAMALNRIGFPHVYGVEPGGEHEDFSFERRNDGQSVRDGHPLRCLFVASHQPLSSARLVPLVD